MRGVPEHVQRLLDRDEGALWAHLKPESSRRLLLAALDSFATVGFSGATTRDISNRAEMSPAAVYVHYSAKADLLQEILEVAYGDLWEAVRVADRDGGSATEQLRNFAESFVIWHACNPTLARVLRNELRFLPQDRSARVLGFRRDIEALLQAELRRGVGEDLFVVADSDEMAAAVISLCGDAERWASARASIKDIPRLAVMYGNLVVRMVRPWSDDEFDSVGARLGQATESDRQLL